MEVKKAIKKVIALGAGATMVGATIMGAMAANLADYPSPFVKDGKFDAIIVVGDTAAASDVIGSVDIATSLQFSMKKSAGSGSGVYTSVEGDAFLIKKSGDNLNFYETSPVDVATSDELKALAGGSISNDKGTYSYDQYLTVADNMKVVFEEDNDQDEDPALYLKFPDGKLVYTYRLSFPTALKSDVDSSDDLDDYDNKKLTMLGSEYTIINTDNSTGRLELMGGAIEDTMQEGETRTFTLNDKDYEVEVVIITDTGTTKTKLKINGEVTDELQSGETYTLNDKTEIGIKSLLSNEAGDVTGDMVEFYLGAKKVVFEDSDWASTASSGTLEVGSDTVNDVDVHLVGSYGSDTTLSKIEVNYNASDNLYVPVGGKFSDRLEAEDKNQMLFERIDYEFGAVDFGTQALVKLQASGSEKYKVRLTTKTDSSELSFEPFYLNTTNKNVTLGESADKRLVTVEGSTIYDEWYFIVEKNKYSHLLQLKDFSTTSEEVRFKNVATGETFKVSASNATLTSFFMDGYEYKFTPTYGVDTMVLNDITDGSDGIADLWTKQEARVVLNVSNPIAADVNRTYGLFWFWEDEDGKEDDSTNQDMIYAQVKYDGTSKLTLGTINSTDGNFSLLSLDSVDDKQQTYTAYGTFVEKDTSGDQDTLELLYPSKQAEAHVYLTSGVTKITSGEGSDVVTEIVKIEVGAAQLASAIAGEETKHNLILVGGPCANKAASVIMGNPENCVEGFEAGKAMIKMYENDGNVAMLVAGYSADDTRRAAKVVANFDDYDLSGMEVEVSGTSMSDITVTKVTE